MMETKTQVGLIGLSGGVLVGGILVAGLQDAWNMKTIDLSEREVFAIEHGVPDSQAAQSLEKKLTEQFGQSGFAFEVRAPEPEHQDNATNTKAPSASPQ